MSIEMGNNEQRDAHVRSNDFLALDRYPITFQVAFEGSTVVSRKEWGVSWNAAIESGGVVVSDKVTLEFEVAAVKV